MRTTDTLIVGAGQAGLALSHHLAMAGHQHVVLERGRIGQRWRAERWDSLRLLTPAWANALPGTGPGPDPDGFLHGRAFGASLAGYARSFGAPVHEGARVRRAVHDGDGFVVQTTATTWRTRRLVVATGDCDAPVVPAVGAHAPGRIAQLHASAYRRPELLAPGGVLVVGAGASGQQIALELARAGRDVVLAAGRHARMPRRYRGHDIYRWLDVLGEHRQPVATMPDPAGAERAPSLPLSGSGQDLDLGVLQAAGVRVTGRLTGFEAGHARFDVAALGRDVRVAEERLAHLLDRVDALVAAEGSRADGFPSPSAAALPAPARVRSRVLAARPAPVRLEAPPQAVALDGIATIVWATGFRPAWPWLRVPVATTPAGRPVHRRGVTATPGLMFLGLRMQHTRASHTIGGVGADAGHLADLITARALRRAA